MLNSSTVQSATMHMLSNVSDKSQQSVYIDSGEKVVPSLKEMLNEKLAGNYFCLVRVPEVMALQAAVEKMRGAQPDDLLAALENLNHLTHLADNLITACGKSDLGKVIITEQIFSRLKNEISSPTALKMAKEEPEVDHNKQLKKYFNDGDTKAAIEYMEKHKNSTDVNYEKGIFLLRAAEDNNTNMIDFLLKKGANVKVFDALAEAAHSGHKESTELLFNYLIGNNKSKYYGNVDKLIDKIKLSTAYDNHTYIKELFDSLSKAVNKS